MHEEAVELPESQVGESFLIVPSCEMMERQVQGHPNLHAVSVVVAGMLCGLYLVRNVSLFVFIFP